MHHTRFTRRRLRRGVTLFEVLIVVALLALISAGVAIAAFSKVAPAKTKVVTTSARAVRQAVKLWWLEHGSTDCPTVRELVAGGALDRDNAERDAWGEPWQIVCEREDVVVVSSGRDRQQDTADDIRVPPG